MASFVPEPIEKCAVCAASPRRTTLPWCHVSFFTVTNWPHVDLLASSFSRAPLLVRRCLPKSSSMYAMLSSVVALSSPAAKNEASSHSTMKVLVSSSKRYACTWNMPCAFSSK